MGFRTDLDFGKTADLVAAYEPEADGKEIYKHVQQAYLSLLAGDKLQLDAGKFVTPHRGRGDRVPGQLELQPLGAVRLRDPVLPPGPARDPARERQGHPWTATS